MPANTAAINRSLREPPVRPLHLKGRGQGNAGGRRFGVQPATIEKWREIAARGHLPVEKSNHRWASDLTTV